MEKISWTDRVRMKKYYIVNEKNTPQDGQCMYNVAMIRVRTTIGALEKQGIQHAMRMQHTVICGLSGCKIFFYFSS
jgi:hypothetical protein